ncbi:MAG: hypothetical protein U1B77_04260, partial [Dehalococcoidales bacterium]|nr:hypothetical protein [Dehalococcoidales bacterium]
ELRQKLELLRKHRRTRAHRILEKLNTEFARENIEPFTGEDIKKIEDSVDGAFGRPHIAGYLVEKGIVSSIQEAFDKYLVRCNVPKLPPCHWRRLRAWSGTPGASWYWPTPMTPTGHRW